MKPAITLWAIIGVLTLALIVGCATHSLNSTLFNGERLAADAALNATHDFNTIYPETNTTPKVAAARAEIYGADKSLSDELVILDAMRREYATNSNPTNGADILGELEIVQQESTNIVNLVNSLK